MNHTPHVTLRAVAMVVVATILVSCTTPPPPEPTPTPAPSHTVSPSPEPSPTPTPTLTPDQEEVLDVLQNYWRTYDAAELEQESPNELYKYGRGDAVVKFIIGRNELRQLGYSWQGTTRRYNVVPGEETKIDGRRTILVRACTDMAQMALVDESGENMLAPESRGITPIEVSVQYWKGEGWFVTGMKNTKHKGC